MSSAPHALHALAHEVLSDQPEARRELFGMQLDRWWDPLISGLRVAYTDDVADLLSVRLIQLAATAFGERDPELARLDLQRILAPDWFQQPSMLGYAAYADRFGSTLRGVAEKIP